MDVVSAFYTSGADMNSGGVIAGLIGSGFEALFSIYGAIPVFFFAFVVLMMIVFKITPARIAQLLRKRERIPYEPIDDDYGFEEEPELPLFDKHTHEAAALPETVRRAPVRGIDIPVDDEAVVAPRREKRSKDAEALVPDKKRSFFNSTANVKTPDEVISKEPTVDVKPLSIEEAAEIAGVTPVEIKSEEIISDSVKQTQRKKMDEAELISETELVAKTIEENSAASVEYRYPPVELLRQGKGGGADGREEIAMNRDRLQATLNSFGVNAKISDITRGPTVTRYDLELEAGVKLTKLTNLAGDLALSLGVSNVRIAPIPDKISTVGVEVPNKIVSTVYLRDIIGSDNFKNAPSRLTFAIGKDIGGESICGNIAKLPHMLIAGTTGSGKSVCMNSLILSLLYKATPEEVRLIMIDPKMVELGIYNGIPHLYIPVVTDPKKAAGALQWSVVEMLKRYRLFSEAGVRDLKAYNERQKKLGEPILPQVVIVIDELADLMLVASKEVEESICRVAQMGRASGMHLVIATQRPSADVITGLMKANIPSRIAFAVSSAMESRIILDQQGAEKLVGSGDMLYAPIGAGKPLRIQGAFVSDEEREEIVNFVKSNSTADYSDEILAQIEKAAEEKSGASSANEAESVSGDAGGDYDELLPQAVEVIFETKQASVSMLQRRLKLGYSRAARIVDQLEEVGVVGPFEGSKPRQIIMTHEQWQQHPLNGGSGESVPEQINFSEYENEDTIGEDE
ncbi:MAG: DNA translocase FtsK [Oscillospiraceae bacterium]|nr:DNA translocase FtsK [Oscillospiraceae bacterium]